MKKNLTSKEIALKERLWGHLFERPDKEFDLLRRLMVEQRWSLEKSREGIEEYRKFCFLAVAADHPVTPSGEIDQIWHTHLIHTRDYWTVFCPHILLRDLHHGPTEGGALESHKYYEQYAKTLATYYDYFGAPPKHWWPCARKRFEPMGLFWNVYTPDYLIFKNPFVVLKGFVHRLRLFFGASQ